MKVTLCSMFRNSERYIPRYFDQIARLQEHVDIRLVLAEGDSVDLTPALVKGYATRSDTVLSIDHDGPDFGSVDHPQRWAQISVVVRGMLEHVGDPGDAFIWVESDLIWDPETMLRLLKAGRCVAPLVKASDDPQRLYDYWGPRQDGKVLNSQPPYFHFQYADQYVKVDSCGSCFVIPGKDYPEVVDGWDGVWPFTANGRLWMDQEAIVRHP